MIGNLVRIIGFRQVKPLNKNNRNFFENFLIDAIIDYPDLLFNNKII